MNLKNCSNKRKIRKIYNRLGGISAKEKKVREEMAEVKGKVLCRLDREKGTFDLKSEGS